MQSSACPDWYTAMCSLQLALTGTQPCAVFNFKNFLWIYCAGNTEVRENEQADIDRLPSCRPDMMSAMLGSLPISACRAELLRSLRNFLNMDRPEHHNSDHLMGRRGGEEVPNIPPSEVVNDLCLSRQILVLF